MNLIGIDINGNPEDMYQFQGKEKEEAFGLLWYDFLARQYDQQLGRFMGIDPVNQFASGYVGMGNNPVSMIDPDGRIAFIIPQIGWSKKGGLSLGLEIGIGVPGVLSASVTFGYNAGSKQGYWSAQGYAGGFYAGYGSQGGFGGWGYRYGGFSGGVSYGRDGFGIGLSVGATVNNYNGAVGIGWSQNGGWDFNVSGGYTKILENTSTKIAEYNLENAPTTALKQKDGFDCLICATTWADQLWEGRSYDQIKDKFGDSYNPEKGTDTGGALKKAYGEENVSARPEFVPNRDMRKGGYTVIAKDKNHAIIPTNVEMFTITAKKWKVYDIFNFRYQSRTSGNSHTVINIRYMDPAYGKFMNTGNVKSYPFPSYRVTPK